MLEKFKDTTRAIKNSKPKDRQRSGRHKKDQKTNNDLQNITYKTKDRATRTRLKKGVNSGAPEGTCGTSRVSWYNFCSILC